MENNRITHVHKAIAVKSTERGWTVCVTPQKCAAHPHRQEAHGNIIQQDVCACGAVRATEINGGRKNYGPWVREVESCDF
jgi:hypothetical protein